MINWLTIKKASVDKYLNPVTDEEADTIKRYLNSREALLNYYDDSRSFNVTPDLADFSYPESLKPELGVSYKDGKLYLGKNIINPGVNDATYENGKSVWNRQGETLDPDGNVLLKYMPVNEALKRMDKRDKLVQKIRKQLNKRYKRGETREAVAKSFDPTGKLMVNNIPFDTSITDGAHMGDLLHLRAGRELFKEAADYNTWYNSNSPRITPNINEVAYLINHPDFMKQHMDNVRSDLKAFRLRDSQKGPFASRYTKPLTARQTIKQQALADNYDSKFLNKDEKEINRYSKRLQKAISKFKDKYGAGSRHPYQGEGLPISRRHQDTSFYVIPV